MKQSFIILILILISISLVAQEFEYNPAQQRARFQGTSGDASVEMAIDQSGNIQHGVLNITDSESHPFIKMTYLNGGQIIVDEFEGDFKSELSKERISFLSKGTPTYQMDVNDGFTAVDDNQNTLYQISGNAGFRAFDANGNMSVQIRGNVGGDGRVSTDELEIMGGSDLSENFDIIDHEESIEAGLIVSIIGEEGKLAISTTKRDSKVVGVISGANGIETGLLMGQKGSIADGDYPIALTGRTYVYATTENGPIKPGDFITTSSKPGYGMKVKKYKKAQGAIIGKAMTSLDAGSGMVLLLINLQ